MATIWPIISVLATETDILDGFVAMARPDLDLDKPLNAVLGTGRRRAQRKSTDRYSEFTARCAEDGLIHKTSHPPRQLASRSSPSPLLGPEKRPTPIIRPRQIQTLSPTFDLYQGGLVLKQHMRKAQVRLATQENPLRPKLIRYSSVTRKSPTPCESTSYCYEGVPNLVREPVQL